MNTLLNDYVGLVIRATQDNDHNHAVILMATYVTKKHNRLEGVDALVKSADAVETLRRFYGHMPQHLEQIRRDVINRCESFMTAEEQKLFHDAR